MMMQPTFRELFERYISKRISTEEISLLRQYIQDEKNGALLDELLSEAFVNKQLAAVSSDDELQQVFQAFMKKAKAVDGLKDREDFFRSESFWRRGWFRYAAAVLLLLGLAAAMERLARPRAERMTAKTAASPIQKTDVSPGKDHAVLTLAGGAQMILDSGMQQIIPSQGGTAVSNQSGQVSYHPGKGQTVPVFNSMTTARGNQYRMMLPDGTRVWLNAASTLRFPTSFAGNERRVELTGEGYFAVAPDEKHPFVVSIHDEEIRVLGTEFNIMAYSDEVSTQTTLVTGSVRIDHGNAQARIRPGEMAEMKDGSFRVKVADTSQVIAWRYGKLSFNHVDLQKVMRQICRWYDVDVTYEGTVPKKQLGGLMSRDVPLSTVLEFLESSGVHVRQEGKHVIFLP